MVRRRSRKYYDEEDDNDTDSDFSADNHIVEPVQKKYSLRQRKRTLFTEDFDPDYDVEEEEERPKRRRRRRAADDDDYEVELEEDEEAVIDEYHNIGNHFIKPASDDEYELELDAREDSEFVTNSTFINHYEPEVNTIPEDTNELIDFEDMIRADIVVNKNRIDYDNLIQKTEIKIQQSPAPAKRGRKPKIPKVEKVELPEEQITVPDNASIQNDNQTDDFEGGAIDCASLMETQFQEHNSTNSDDMPLMPKTKVESTDGEVSTTKPDDEVKNEGVTEKSDESETKADIEGESKVENKINPENTNITDDNNEGEKSTESSTTDGKVENISKSLDEDKDKAIAAPTEAVSTQDKNDDGDIVQLENEKEKAATTTEPRDEVVEIDENSSQSDVVFVEDEDKLDLSVPIEDNSTTIQKNPSIAKLITEAIGGNDENTTESKGSEGDVVLLEDKNDVIILDDD